MDFADCNRLVMGRNVNMTILIVCLIIVVMIMYRIIYIKTKLIQSKNLFIKKLDRIIIIFDMWKKKNDNGKYIYNYLSNKGIKHIAIYGVGKIGEAIQKEIAKSNITIEYFIDRKIQGDNNGIKIYRIEDELPMVDLVIISLVDDLEVTFESLRSKADFNIITIEALLNEL